MGWGLLAFGFVVGVLSGLTGIGGGVVLVPGLILLFGLSQTEAQGTSLAVLMLPVVGFAVMVYYQSGYIRLSNVAFVACGFAVGAYIGARIVPYVSVAWLKSGLGVVLLYVSMLFIMDSGKQPVRAALPTGITVLLAKLWAFIRRDPNRPTPPSAMNFEKGAEYHI